MRGLPQPPDMAFDPKAMEAFLQMSSMGMPPYPGMPGMPPQGFGGGRNQPRRRGRCRDFDTKGFCSRGSTCPYDHGNESIFVPPMGDGMQRQLPLKFTELIVFLCRTRRSQRIPLFRNAEPLESHEPLQLHTRHGPRR